MRNTRASRMPSWLRYATYLGLAILAVSGLGWLLLDQFVRIEGEFGPERVPLQHWLLVVHGVAAYSFLLVLGLVAGTHAIAGWMRGRNRISGSVVIACLNGLFVTGLLLYYAGADGLREWSSTVHWSLGLFAVLALPLHIVLGRHTPKR